MAELNSQNLSVQSIYGLFRSDKLYVNRRYQRKLVWTLEEKQKLIDSILNRYPIPAILVAEREDSPGSYEIIDGLQRLHAIVGFIETTFPTLDDRYFSIENFPTAKAAADDGQFVPAAEGERLAQGDVSTILDYTLAMSVMRNASDAEVNDVFDRINTYGHRLSDQERRQAGIENEFSRMVRQLACEIRGDVASEVLPLRAMPSISIDLPMTKHGYEVRADEVFWVRQGVLRSTDLRDSMDEQCIADIAASVVGGNIVERSKNALDSIYANGAAESERLLDALEVYGGDRFKDEFKFCIEEILKVCEAGGASKLRDVVYRGGTTNAFPAQFALLLIAFHELIVGERMLIADHFAVKRALDGLSDRVDTSRRSTASLERRRNIDTIKGLIRGCFIKGEIDKHIYSNHSVTDLEGVIRRSEVELANYELKQGLLRLSGDRGIDEEIVERVARTICGIANNGPESVGKVLIGVADSEADARRVSDLDEVQPRRVGRRFVVGVSREARLLGEELEAYYGRWKDGIRNSGLSESLREAVLAHMDFNDYFGLGIIVVTIPAQKELSFFGDDVYYRSGDETRCADSSKMVAELTKRFRG